ncbi:MAG: hypothetical protein KGZ72_11955 [Roseovarius sp.]|nr:hypothetical protein [Roseovarius sp.]
MARKYIPNRRTRRTNRNPSSTLLALLMLIGATIIAGGFAYLYMKSSNREVLDVATLCPKRGPLGHLAILIDLTDPASMTQMRFARAAIEKQIESVQVGTMISIGTVTPDEGRREGALLMVCKPPSGADADRLTENPKIIEEKYQVAFVQPLAEMLTKTLTISEASSSPIMENLQEFLSRIPDFGEVSNQRLVIFSNLSQHSDVLSFYRGEDWKAFEENGGLSKLARNLSNTEVVLLRLPEPSNQTEILEDFWARYFDVQGAKSVDPIVVGEY